MKIVTVTINPAIDFTVYTDALNIGEINLIHSTRKDSGGKGINVSKVLKNLGIHAIATGFLGGSAGEWIKASLNQKSIAHEFLDVDGETRTNVKIIADNVETQLNGAGPALSENNIDSLCRKINQLLETGDGLILAGSIPKGSNPAIYQEIINSLEKNVFIALDTSGSALKETLQAQPHFIKPNDQELSELIGKELNTEEDLILAAKQLVADGIRYVLVSRGEKGSILASDAGIFKAVPPKITANSTIGAGDSTVAGFVGHMIEKNDLKASFVFSNACGVATALKAGTDVCTRSEVEAVMNQIKLIEL